MRVCSGAAAVERAQQPVGQELKPSPQPAEHRCRGHTGRTHGGGDAQDERGTVRVTGGAQARLSSTTGSRITLTGVKPGPVQVRVVLQQPGGTPPYTVRVGLAQALLDLEAAGGEVVIRKDQYDLVMNVLNHLCPVGVEIDTRAAREHVLELRDALLEAFPPYTYPDFRARGPRPPGWTFGLEP
jgi:hypothetical protein